MNDEVTATTERQEPGDGRCSSPLVIGIWSLGIAVPVVGRRRSLRLEPEKHAPVAQPDRARDF